MPERTRLAGTCAAPPVPAPSTTPNRRPPPYRRPGKQQAAGTRRAALAAGTYTAIFPALPPAFTRQQSAINSTASTNTSPSTNARSQCGSENGSPNSVFQPGQHEQIHRKNPPAPPLPVAEQPEHEPLDQNTVSTGAPRPAGPATTPVLSSAIRQHDTHPDQRGGLPQRRLPHREALRLHTQRQQIVACGQVPSGSGR